MLVLLLKDEATPQVITTLLNVSLGAPGTAVARKPKEFSLPARGVTKESPLFSVTSAMKSLFTTPFFFQKTFPDSLSL